MRKKDDEKQRNIKEAVIKLILEEGFHGTSMSKIAKEAGVSPATVYIYYENKEVMLQDIYREYSEGIFSYLLCKIHKGMDGEQLIERLIRSYYNYINENEEVFNFVEQFSSCPSLASQCEAMNGIHDLNGLLDELKELNIIKDYRNDTLIAIIFSPVKEIASNTCRRDEEKNLLLQEMVKILQKALLV
jgi:AcrR family transcriptional regulator